ncbi:MAG TPA: DUF1801 domain-containing protein [Fimbriimonadaceae bacterium]|jgi:hypothetical protein
MHDAGELINFLAPYPDHVVEIMLECRSILLKMLSPIIELQFDATAAVCDGFSYLPNAKGVFVNTAAYSDHATLIFGYGAGLNDPEGRLKGGGKQVRHIRLKSSEDLNDPYVIGLIQQASATATRHADEVVPEVIVKIYEGAKRRPKS